MGRSCREIQVWHFGPLNPFPLAWFMKIHLSLLVPFFVNGFFATATLTFAQEPTISIGYPSEGETFEVGTIPYIFGAADPGGWPWIDVSVSVVQVGGGNHNPVYYTPTGTAFWEVYGPIDLPVTEGVPSVFEITATGTVHAGSVFASVTVYYNPPVPTVSISTPTNGQAFTTSSITVSGAAQIDQSPPPFFPPEGLIVTLVQVQANGTDGTWQTASGTTNWSASVSLSPGANTIYARSQDLAGWFSTNVVVNVTCHPPITPPVLGTMMQYGCLVFTWPTNESGFVLQCSPNLGAAAVWSTNMPFPVVVGAQNVVTNPLSESRMFFRLYLPPGLSPP